MCWSKSGNQRALALDETKTQDPSDDDETLTLTLPFHCMDDSQFITLRVRSGSYIRFQVDTGVQCNVHTNIQVTAHSGTTLPVVAHVTLVVWREASKYCLDCRLVDSQKDPSTVQAQGMPEHESHQIPRQICHPQAKDWQRPCPHSRTSWTCIHRTVAKRAP